MYLGERLNGIRLNKVVPFGHCIIKALLKLISPAPYTIFCVGCTAGNPQTYVHILWFLFTGLVPLLPTRGAVVSPLVVVDRGACWE